MKSIIFLMLLLCCLFSSEVFCRNYQEGDILNCFAQSGLNLRNSPSIDAEIISVIPFGRPVLVVNTFKFENEFENKDFRGNWIKIEFDKLSGYVFDAYLSKLQIPSLKSPEIWSCYDPVMVLNEYLKSSYEITSSEAKQEVNHQVSTLSSGETHSHFYRELTFDTIGVIRFHGYWEGMGTEIIFHNCRKSEIVNLILAIYSECKNISSNIKIVVLKDREVHKRFSQYIRPESENSLYFYQKGRFFGILVNQFT